MTCIAAIQAFQRMSRDLRELRQGVPQLDRFRSVVPGGGAPARFLRYADEAGRFELLYPSGWTLQTHDGVHVASPRIGSFARVDIGPGEGDPWNGVEAAFARAGVNATIRRRTPTLLRGTLELEPLRFAWDARAFRSGSERIILSLGNVVDPSRAAVLERYEDGVLAAIRRSFRAHRRP